MSLEQLKRKQAMSEPFLVFGLESPSFGYRMFGGHLIWDHRPEDKVFPGSALAIGGGDLLTREGEVVIEPSGALRCAGWQYCERIVADLVDPEWWVTVVYDTAMTTYHDWIRHARHTQYDVIETGQYIVCLGKGRHLHALHWLEGLNPANNTFLIASPRRDSFLEQSIAENARAGADVAVILDDFWLNAASDPEIISRDVQGYGLLAAVGGYEYSDVFINRADPAIDDARHLLCKTAWELDVPVYDAGSITDLLSVGYFSWDEEWRAIPAQWSACR